MSEGQMSSWVPLLLADRSPALRLLVLRELLARSEDDPECQELAGLRPGDPLVADLLALQEEDGSWQVTGRTAAGSGRIQATTQALIRLGYLGFGPELPAVRRGAEYLFGQQRPDGAWPLVAEVEESEKYRNYDMIPLQTAIPLRGLATAGYAADPRAEAAYEWLLAQRLPDGAWPTGTAEGTYGRVAGYRRLPHSRWGCRSNSTGALICLALHPQRRQQEPARRALDLLLGREAQEQHSLGFEVARILGAEPARGLFTYYARLDAAQLLDLCWRVGAGREDERVASLVDFVLGNRGPYGLWRYTSRPQVGRWLTFDLLRSLSRLDENTDWISLEPRTPFQPYPPVQGRY
jgi:hypothetical protein